MSLARLVQRRLIIVTGKGGVGKTTLTAALARHYAESRRRVLAAEIVPTAETPSQLAIALGVRGLTEEPQRIAPNLSAVLVTPTAGHHRFLQASLPIKLLADTAMRSQALRKFLSAAPGFSDMGVMYRMLDLLRLPNPAGGHAYEIVLLDSPATGHALALAQIPEFLIRVIPAGPIRRVAEEGLAVLTDPRITGTLIVTLPELLPVTEALELQEGLTKHRLPVSAIVVNRVPNDPFSKEERAAVSEVLSAQGGLVLGARELRRIERAQAALAVLRERATADHVVLSEVEGAGSHATLALLPAL
ncbi:MAG: ArsA family ATPase [Myxococcaceae bacterium]|nr:ArsA family ATPase [Myxococcaceae bacterium]